MDKRDKRILLILTLLVIGVLALYLARGYFHTPAVQNEVDSLETLKTQAKANAEIEANKSDSSFQLYEKHKKRADSPIGADERERLYSDIERKAKADSSRRSAIR